MNERLLGFCQVRLTSSGWLGHNILHLYGIVGYLECCDVIFDVVMEREKDRMDILNRNFEKGTGKVGIDVVSL